MPPYLPALMCLCMYSINIWRARQTDECPMLLLEWRTCCKERMDMSQNKKTRQSLFMYICYMLVYGPFGYPSVNVFCLLNITFERELDSRSFSISLWTGGKFKKNWHFFFFGCVCVCVCVDRRAQTFQKGLSTLTDLLTDNVQQPETRSIVFLCVCVCVRAMWKRPKKWE